MAPQAYWKQFVAWGTAFVRRYQTDVFFRTGLHVILLQVGLTLALLSLVYVFVSALYEEVVFTLLDAISTAIEARDFSSIDSSLLAQDLEYTKLKSAVLFGTVILMLASVFGYLAGRLALSPARRALESQKQFVGNIAHELRTPLAVLKTNTEVTLFEEHLPKSARELLTSNLEELSRISNIINNLLSMNRLLRPERIVFSDININGVIEHTLLSLAPLVNRKNIHVTFTEKTPLSVWGNTAGVEQIMMNVIKNALNYTPQGGSVTIEARPTVLGRIEVMISDTGMGIPEKDLDHIFEPFYRGDRSRTKQGSDAGSGLGLAIVSELVKIHRGRISISSEVGVGTTVTITLPSRGKKNSLVPNPREVFVDFLKNE